MTAADALVPQRRAGNAGPDADISDESQNHASYRLTIVLLRERQRWATRSPVGRAPDLNA
jgi:hypothetical protein